MVGTMSMRRGWLGLSLLVLGASAPGGALAAEVESKVWTRVSDEGEVIALAKIPASAAKVREVLADAERSHLLAPTTIEVQAKPDGACSRVKLKVRGVVSPFHLEARRCPTATGFRETLIASDDFVEYHNEWTIQETGDGVLVSFRSRSLPNVSVPESFILSQTRKVLVKLMTRLSDEVLGAR